ncbi:MAG: ABC-F family ATP-binding cassette domain-containing protein [Chitinophagales bacterium]|nr:ABC-F family ATP-binding cassette domain-containing protein [Chitinophagales bacterium]
MISVQNITLRFGGRTLFENVTFLINREDRIGLTGKNGAGKSTLLKILSGSLRAESGSIATPRDCRIAILTQDIEKITKGTVVEEARNAFKEILAIQKKIADITHQLETRTDYESDAYMKLIEDLGDLQNHNNILESDNIEAEIERILKGLGFDRKDMNKNMAELSGGWQMRVELAKILLQRPDLILLDEPTNHLDIESILWLENFLKEYDGAVILVSHDKAFLDAVTNRTIEVTLGRIEDYKANYSKYLELRKERRVQVENAYKNQQEQIRQIERNIDKFRAKANKASFAQSLIKQLERMDKIELEDEDNSKLNIKFPKSVPSGVLICDVKEVSKSYGAQQVINHFSFKVERGDRIAFVGKNGMGKSTLAKILANDIDNYQGTVEWGHNIVKGYFAQNQEAELNNSKTVFETIDEEAVGDMRTAVRALLGAFLFSGEDVDKKVSVLSGGERGRLAMCKLMLTPNNFLILDEPTNHLDIKSKEVLKQALEKFDGTFIVVSHDREFLQGLTNKTYEFTNNGIKEFLGTIDEFLEKKKVDGFRQFEQDKIDSGQKLVVNGQSKVVTQKQESINKVDNGVKEIEKKIEKLEGEIKKWEVKMASEEFLEKAANDSSAYDAYNKLKMDLELAMSEWEALV